MNWQGIVVVLIITLAAFYAARRAMRRLRSFVANKGACTTGCGSCDNSSPQNATFVPKTFVQINRTPPTAARRPMR